MTQRRGCNDVLSDEHCYDEAVRASDGVGSAPAPAAEQFTPDGETIQFTILKHVFSRLQGRPVSEATG